LAKPVYLFSFLFLLFACEEDVTTLGFKTEQSKLKVYYAELSLPSSVLLMDSLRTTNLTGETNRILAGSYNDPVFGSMQAQSITQFRPYTVNTVIPTTATFDSVVLQMRYDFYTYGTSGETTQTFDIYEITQELFPENGYYSNSEITKALTPIGTKSMNVNAEFFKQEFEDTDKDSVITLNVKLSNSFGERLFEAVDPEDVNYTDFELFKGTFKGLTIIPAQADKIVGFNPADLNSFLTLYYHDAFDTASVSFIFTQCISFSKIASDRSSTELSGLNQYSTDFDPGPKRYIQGGTSIVTKVDFTKFYDYMDTLSNIIINSAEFDFSGVEASSYNPPQSLSMTMLRPNNRFKTLTNLQDTTDYLLFQGLIYLGDQGKFLAAESQGTLLETKYSSTDLKYNAFPTLFVQKLFDLKSSRYPFWALRPLTPQPGKSVDRVVLPKDNIKLKIYYTRATLTNQ
jgi:hypothetical protein